MLAAQRGEPYARAILSLVAGLKAKASQGPGATIVSDHVASVRLTATGKALPAPNGQFDVQADNVSLLAKMIAYLVANCVLKAKAGVMPMTADVQACPGIPGEHSGEAEIGMISEIESNPGIPTAADMASGATSIARMTIGGSAPTNISSTATVHKNCALTHAKPTTIDSRHITECGMTARMVLSIPPELADGKLYIRQVYAAEKSGTTLRIH